MLHFSLIQLVYAFMHCTFCYILTAVCFDRFTLLRRNLSPWGAFLRAKAKALYCYGKFLFSAK